MWFGGVVVGVGDIVEDGVVVGQWIVWVVFVF